MGTTKMDSDHIYIPESNNQSFVSKTTQVLTNKGHVNINLNQPFLNKRSNMLTNDYMEYPQDTNQAISHIALKPKMKQEKDRQKLNFLQRERPDHKKHTDTKKDLTPLGKKALVDQCQENFDKAQKDDHLCGYKKRFILRVHNHMFKFCQKRIKFDSLITEKFIYQE